MSTHNSTISSDPASMSLVEAEPLNNHKPVRRRALALTAESSTPMGMLAIAVSQNADLEKLAKLMELQERWEATEARKAFVESMAAFKTHAISVGKDKVNPQYKSKYVSLGNLVSTVTPFLSQHGLSVHWEIDQSEGIRVSCVITHVAGHSEMVSMVVPPDKSGAKNPIQEIKSAITYAKACTFESICGLASTDSNLDDDANAMSNGNLNEKIEWIGNARNLDELKRLFQDALKDAVAAQSKGAVNAIVAAKDKRKAELTVKP